MKEYSKFHSADYRKPLEISHWEALQRLKSLLELPTATIVILQSDTYVTAGKTFRHLRNILDRLEGIGRGCDNGMETRAAMALANGVRHKLARYYLASHCWLTWTSEVTIFFITSLYFIYFLSSFFVVFFHCFCVYFSILKHNSTPYIVVNLYPYCTIEYLRLWPSMIIYYTARGYGALASHVCITRLTCLLQHMTL